MAITREQIFDDLVGGKISREEASKMMDQLDAIRKALEGEYTFSAKVDPEEKVVLVSCGKGAPMKLGIVRGEILFSEANSAIVREKIQELRTLLGA